MLRLFFLVISTILFYFMGSYDPCYDPMIYALSMPKRSSVGSRVWQPYYYYCQGNDETNDYCTVVWLWPVPFYSVIYWTFLLIYFLIEKQSYVFIVVSREFVLVLELFELLEGSPLSNQFYEDTLFNIQIPKSLQIRDWYISPKPVKNPFLFTGYINSAIVRNYIYNMNISK